MSGTRERTARQAGIPMRPGPSPAQMACGHTANGRTPEGLPACAICIGIVGGAQEVVASPDLTLRLARCLCGKECESDDRLPFFEYRGPGSSAANEVCKVCEFRHRNETFAAELFDPKKRRWVTGPVHDFEPIGDRPDLFYCGHDGWN